MLTGLVAIPLLALAGSLLFYQLLLLLCVALAPFVLTLALWWPAGAERIIRRLSMRMLGALVMPVILGLTLSVLLLLIVAGDRVGKDWTWTLVGLIHALLGIAAWRFRNDWLLLFRRHGEEPVSRSPLMQQNRLGTRDAWTAAPVIGSSAPNRAYREGHEPAPMGGHTPVRPDSHRDSRESEKMSDRPLSVRGENQLARFSEHVLRVREELQAGQRTVTWPRPADLPGPEPRVGVGASPSPASTPMPWSHSSQRRQSHESRP